MHLRRLNLFLIAPQAIRTLICILFLFHFRAGAEGYLIDAWDSENGLPDNFVTSVVQTPDGYLWVGTYNGLARFDGSKFVTFNPENTAQLGHARIVKLFLDANGTLWINTYDGSLISWHGGVFTREWEGGQKGMSEVWLVANNPNEIIFSFRSGLLLRRSLADGEPHLWRTLKPPGSPPGAFYCMDQTGTLWCSTLDGNLWRVIHDQFERAPTETDLHGREIHWVCPDTSGRIWVGTEKELAVWDGQHFQDRTPTGETNLNVAFLFFRRDGGTLIAANGHLREYSGRKWLGELNAWPDLMQEQQLQLSLTEDREGGLWRTSRGLGIFHITPDGATEQITTANGLPGEHTTCWLQDREGNIWVGLGNNGLARLKKRYFDTIRIGLNRPATSVCQDQSGALWMGIYGGGLYRLQDGNLNHFNIPTRTPGEFVFSIYPTGPGQLWLSGGMEDAFVFEDGQAKPAPVAVHGVKCILADKSGGIWMGRKDGVDRWAEGKLREWNSHNGSIAKPVRALAQDRSGSIWIGADDGNIYRAEGDELHAVPLPNFQARQAIWSLLCDADGSLWIGTSDAGLLHYENGRFTRFTAKDGLPDDLICQILDDGLGNLWLGSHQGICRVSKSALRDFAAGKTFTICCSSYGRLDGLPTLQCADMYQPSAWRGNDGTLWFATVKGVVSVQPSKIAINSNLPPVVIETFLADGKIQPRFSEKGSGAEIIKVAPGKQNFEFHYTALSLTDPDKIRFRYRLEGLDSDWMNAGSRRWVQYNYLRPGTYHFHVMACNNDGLWSNNSTTVDLQILPHFWETWPFRIALSLIFIGAIIAAARHISRREMRLELQRLARQRDLEQDRARIARDIHDQIGSGLTRINLLSELLLGDSPDRLPERAGQISGATYELMQSMDEIVWAVNPKNDSLDSLISYLCDFADEFLRAANIRFRINLPETIPSWYLTSEVRHNLFLAANEVLNNIVKHSGASEVVFELRVDGSAATLEIRDNGCGFPMNGFAAGGNGLENLQKRALAFGGHCHICSEPGKGTQIRLIMPAPSVNEKN